MGILHSRPSLIVIISCSIVACGGGGGGGSPGNKKPSVNAGQDQTVLVGGLALLAASATDSDGRIVFYQWAQMEGPRVTTTDVHSPTISVSLPHEIAGTSLTFRVFVLDDSGASAEDFVTITVPFRYAINDIPFQDQALADCVKELDLYYSDSVTYLGCAARGITDTGGLEYLTALKYLELTDNALTTIDLSNNLRLQTLWIIGNQLQSVDLSRSVNLAYLYAQNNRIAAIDLSANENLVTVALGYNTLPSIDLSNSPDLQDLFLEYNRLTSLDLSHNRRLRRVDVSMNTELPCSDIEEIQAMSHSLDLRTDGIDCGQEAWVEGVFEPAKHFKSMCAVPRSGIDPFTGLPYLDQQGARLDENNWLRSWSNETYLWYDEIKDRDPWLYATDAYFDVLKTRGYTYAGTKKDQFHFSMDTAEFVSWNQSGAHIGFGATFFVLKPNPPRKVVVAYTEPGSPATSANANLSRGAELLEIDGVDVVQGNDVDTLNAGLSPSRPGERHQFVVRDLGAANTRSFTMEASVVTSVPVQHVTTLDTLTGRVGYLLFNDHIATAEQQLIDAIVELRDAGVTDLVLDVRYNGGGYLLIASELAYMIAGPASTSGRTFEELRFNDKHTEYNPVTGELLAPIPFLDYAVGFSAPALSSLPTLNLPRVFVLTTRATCSASESIINSLRGVDVDVIQVGAPTCGKPYGFYPTDNCGITYFTIQFQGLNDKGFGDYVDGFWPYETPDPTIAELKGCAVYEDDFEHAFGDRNELLLAHALHYRARGDCALGNEYSARALTSPAAAFDQDESVLLKPEWRQNRVLELPRH